MRTTGFRTSPSEKSTGRRALRIMARLLVSPPRAVSNVG